MTTNTETETANLRERLESAWLRTDAIFAMLDPRAWYERPIPLRQPFIFYLGHLPAFAWNQVVRGVLDREDFRPEFDALFARGIDPVGVDRYEPDAPTQWPEPSEVLVYRDRVRDALRASFDAVAERETNDVLAERGRIWQLVIEHELMHQETLLYMMQQLRRDYVRRPDDVPAYCTGASARGRAVTIPAGTATLGADFENAAFGWDNEFPRHEVEVDAFDVDALPVTNADWIEFVEAGGYDRPELWDADAFAWRMRVDHTQPLFWQREGDTWRYLTLFDDLPLRDVAGWPVFVSHAEATAYARWRGADLMTEAEFHRAAEGAPWGDPRSSNIDLTHWAPIPAGSYSESASQHGVLDLIGNAWEWTRSRFGPFDGFKAYARTYPGYSADFFGDQHRVMLGASWATDAALVRPSFRNWFQPHYPYVFAKFRCVRRGSLLSPA
ncbi:MAG: ergothioneine biosynthesis protein EgtB [Gammaproteobacteria bacterium]|nr:ergothioneine biosynthesis protein EgtB [Gammaproteobacteria bacterium]